jgi:hypothetical protein
VSEQIFIVSTRLTLFYLSHKLGFIAAGGRQRTVLLSTSIVARYAGDLIDFSASHNRN